jgi:hypothetical protein
LNFNIIEYTSTRYVIFDAKAAVPHIKIIDRLLRIASKISMHSENISTTNTQGMKKLGADFQTILG